MKEPKIRFKGFKGEWENTPFSETFDSLKNNSLSRAELSDSGEVMNIHYGDVLIKYGECVDVIKEVETFVKDEEVAKKLHQSCAIKNGDVIFADAAEDNTVGKCSEVIANENDAIVSGLHTIACRPKKDFAPMYLGYYLNSNAYHDQLLPHIQGTKISSISKKAISQTEISSPIYKNEQQSVASYFQHLDSLIQSTTKKIESLKQVKAASLQSMFPQEGETTPRVRFKGFEGEWEKVQFSELYEPSSIKNKTFGADKIISVANMYFKPVSYISDEEYLKSYNVMNLGDIAFEGNKSKDYAHGRFVENTIGDGIVSHVFIVLKPISKQYDLQFWKYLINYERIMGPILLRSTKHSTMMTDLVVSDFLKESVLVPSYEEQIEIGKILSSLDRQITLHTQRLEKLKQIKTACLDEMFV